MDCHYTKLGFTYLAMVSVLLSLCELCRKKPQRSRIPGVGTIEEGTPSSLPLVGFIRLTMDDW